MEAGQKRIRLSTEFDYKWRAEDVLSLVLHDRSFGRKVAVSYPPAFTHQLFAKGFILGWKSPRVSLHFSPSSFYTYLEVSDNGEGRVGDDYTPIEESLKPHLPPDYVTTEEEFDQLVESDEGFKPPGKRIDMVHKDATSRSTMYEVYVGSISEDPIISAIHSRLQLFSMFSVEKASAIKQDDPRWRLYLLYKRNEEPDSPIRHILCGYCTVYSFYVFPDEKRIQISQFVVLPPHQRKGLGIFLMEAIYKDTKATDRLKEINVESPNEEFIKMRDVVDLKLCLSLDVFKGIGIEEFDDEIAKEIRQKTKITLKQIEKCFEMHFLISLDKSDTSYNNHLKRFRLRVKRRFYVEVCQSMGSGAEMKKILAILYRELMVHYTQVIDKYNSLAAKN